MVGTDVAELILRLQLRGYYSTRREIKDSELFDRTVTEAVTAFQRVHGLEADGVVGSATAYAICYQ